MCILNLYRNCVLCEKYILQKKNLLYVHVHNKKLYYAFIVLVLIFFNIINKN